MGESSSSSSMALGAAGAAAAAALVPKDESAKGSGPLKGRATISWMEGAAIAVTVACVMGLVVALIAQEGTYAFFFGVGTIFSAYWVYQAHNASLFKAENFKYKHANAEHKHANAEHVKLLAGQRTELARLEGLNADYGKENKAHKAENEAQRNITELLTSLQKHAKAELEAFLPSLSHELGELKDETSDIGNLAGVLQGAIDTLTKELNVERLQELQREQAKATGTLEALQQGAQVQLEFMDQLRQSFLETFMRILQATQERVAALMPEKGDEVQEAFEAFGTSFKAMKLPTLPPAEGAKA
ncbi:MAG: hypothetical protein KR126chlam2_00797 [Chlamydiae bacterium]|nr:hypothetical protein [Chlamydiota bacterium]